MLLNHFQVSPKDKFSTSYRIYENKFKTANMYYLVLFKFIKYTWTSKENNILNNLYK